MFLFQETAMTTISLAMSHITNIARPKHKFVLQILHLLVSLSASEQTIHGYSVYMSRNLSFIKKPSFVFSPMVLVRQSMMKATLLSVKKMMLAQR